MTATSSSASSSAPGASERRVSMPVLNPDSTGQSRTFRYVGKVDNLTPPRIVDWKSVDEPAAWIQRHTIGYQAELYALALEREGVLVNEIEYRLIQRPSIKLCGKDGFDRARYEERCVAWLRETPGALVTHDVMINVARMEKARRWLWNVAKRVIDCRREGRWLTCEHACQTWGRSCEYLPLCLCAATGGDVEWLMQQDYEQRPMHEELSEQDRNSLDVITYSSATTMALCETRYYYRHELCLSRKHEDRGEALTTGSAMHEGLDVLARSGDVKAALSAVDAWLEAQPVIGEDLAQKQDQQAGRARAMVRVAAEKWLDYEPAAENREGVAV